MCLQHRCRICSCQDGLNCGRINNCCWLTTTISNEETHHLSKLQPSKVTSVESSTTTFIHQLPLRPHMNLGLINGLPLLGKISRSVEDSCTHAPVCSTDLTQPVPFFCANRPRWVFQALLQSLKTPAPATTLLPFRSSRSACPKTCHLASNRLWTGKPRVLLPPCSRRLVPRTSSEW